MSEKKQWIGWTTVEVAILKEIWLSGKPVRACMDRLPRHSLRATLVKGRHLGLPPRNDVRRMESANRTAMREALKTTSHHAWSLAECVGVSHRTAQQFLKEMHEYGVAHICSWRKTARNGPPFAIFAWGKGDDVPAPIPAAFHDRFRRRTPLPDANPFKQLVDYSRAIHRKAA